MRGYGGPTTEEWSTVDHQQVRAPVAPGGRTRQEHSLNQLTIGRRGSGSDRGISRRWCYRAIVLSPAISIKQLRLETPEPNQSSNVCSHNVAVCSCLLLSSCLYSWHCTTLDSCVLYCDISIMVLKPQTLRNWKLFTGVASAATAFHTVFRVDYGPHDHCFTGVSSALAVISVIDC